MGPLEVAQVEVVEMAALQLHDGRGVMMMYEMMAADSMTSVVRRMSSGVGMNRDVERVVAVGKAVEAYKEDHSPA